MNSFANLPMPGRKMAKAVQSVMKMLGPGAGYETVCAACLAEHGFTPSRHSFRVATAHVFSPPPAGKPAASPAAPTGPGLAEQLAALDDFEVPTEKLSAFVRFAFAVEAAGGVANAVRYLRMLSALAQVTDLARLSEPAAAPSAADAGDVDDVGDSREAVAV